MIPRKEEQQDKRKESLKLFSGKETLHVLQKIRYSSENSEENN